MDTKINFHQTWLDLLHYILLHPYSVTIKFPNQNVYVESIWSFWTGRIEIGANHIHPKFTVIKLCVLFADQWMWMARRFLYKRMPLSPYSPLPLFKLTHRSKSHPFLLDSLFFPRPKLLSVYSCHYIYSGILFLQRTHKWLALALFKLSGRLGSAWLRLYSGNTLQN